MSASNRITLVLIATLPLVAAALLVGIVVDDLENTKLEQIWGLLAALAIFVGAGLWFGADGIMASVQSGNQEPSLLSLVLQDFSNQLQRQDYRTPLNPPLGTQSEHIQIIVQDLNRVIERIAATFEQMLPIATVVSEKSEDILSATNEQIGTTADQESSVMQTSSTVQEVRATVTETAERAAAVAEMAQTSVDVSRTGQQAVSEAIEGMNLIRRRVESIADNILVLSEHTQQIGEIIATVSALADQSKLLALNASVEAARAGEEGKGFAVVAMEVRNLAEQSRDATNQVRDILSEIQQATNTAVMVTEEGTKGVDAGVALVNRAGESIRELSGTIEEAAYAAVQIAASTRQQTVGMDQLAAAMKNIRSTSSQTTTSTMSVERAARELIGVSRKLSELLVSFRAETHEVES